MLNLLIISFLSIIIISPLGYIVLKNDNKDFLNYSISTIYGIILISFISLVLNFFFPLSKLINTLLIIIPIFIIYKKPSFFLNLVFFKFCIIGTLIIFLLISKTNVYRPDAYLYHLPFLDILNNNKIIFGLSNLHFRFGHISIMQYSSAIFNNFIFYDKGILLPAAIIATSIIINFFTQLFSYIKRKKFNFHFFYIFFVVIFIVYKMNRFSEYGNDAPAHFLFFLLISEIILNFEKKKKNFSNFILISVFIIMNKISMSFAILLPFVFERKFDKNFLKDKKIYLAFIFLFLWCFKNLIISGCVFYPISKSCISNLPWTDIQTTKKVSIESEAWSKGWSNVKEPAYFDPTIYIKKFNWIKTWVDSHFIKITSILYPYLIFILFTSIYLRFNSKKKILNKHYKKEIKLLLMLTLFTIVWLTKVPLFRLGYSYLISLTAIIFAIYCSKLDNFKNKKILTSILIFAIFVFSLKNLIRIVDFNNNHKANIFPKIKLFENKSELKEINLNGFKYFVSPSECGYGYAPCTHYKNLKLRSINYYSYIGLLHTK